jgi:sugar porter (SP) family MFS transporter
MKNIKIIYWSITVALAGFLFGFDTVVISGADKYLSEYWSSYSLSGSSDLFHGIVVISSALWGTVLGAIYGAFPTDRLGRKNTLFLIGLLFFVSAIGSALVSNPYLFALFRFIGGVGVGASTIAAPAYVSEIAPAHNRGKLVALYQFNIVFGILIAFLSNYLINKWVVVEAWRWMVGIEAVPALIYLVLILGVPKSPRWLYSRGRSVEALQTLMMINESTAQETLKSYGRQLSNINKKTDSIFSKSFRTPLLLVIFIALFNQFSGINAFLYYSPRIFELSGLEEDTALLSSIGIGVVNLFFTLIGLSLIDRVGRKTLMYIGSFGYILSLALVTISFATNWLGIHIVFFFFFFIASHAIGQGAVIWVFISEIFPNQQRAQGQAVGSSTHWILAALIPAFVPVLFSVIGTTFVFGFFTFMMVLQLVWVHYKMPETKGKSLEKLSQEILKK